MMLEAFQAGLRRTLGASALGFGVCMFLPAQSALAADELAKPAESDQAVLDAPGMKAFVDPATGKLVSAPSGNNALPLSAAEKNAMSTSSAGLHEEVNPSTAGGYQVDLQGRFQSPLQAKIDANGKLMTYHPHPFAMTGAAQ
ncbi:post-PEP-CTERM-1 domain-containing protein [Methylocystis parvus]|uniref:Uncharacterized protein n=1 Tax=Methylocystis parvus TaxID=134 RepID=A0A6B8M5I9_9HYPH|nr:hypothetical protein [Methylocystis parvus]QGM96090.1 hypothetical protein F7D14_00320 [Methylocystis parvus]WBK00086.1 hypothetical protein MMG94_19295 [Methylocystis parvus OBBP]